MWIAILLLELAAVYIPPFIAARGWGSREKWIGMALAAFFLGTAAIVLGRYWMPPVDFKLASENRGALSTQPMTAYLLSGIVRVFLCLGFGSFLAVLRYRKRQAASPNLLGLGREVPHQG